MGTAAISKRFYVQGFTPGPWASEGPDQFGDYNIITPTAALAVAAVVSNLRPGSEVAANAKLVAAAPSLLHQVSVLKEALEKIARGAQAIGAGISRRQWNEVEIAHAVVRDIARTALSAQARQHREGRDEMTDTDTIRRNDIDARVEAMKDIRRQAIDDCIKVVREYGERNCVKYPALGMSCVELASRLEALKGST